MNLEDIKAAVAEIEAMKGDDETAHIKEDELHVAFIAYVAAAGPAKLVEMAREVLKTEGIEFCRWHA